MKVVQSLARHSTPVLTLGVYTHLGLYDQTPALDALPDLTKPAPKIGTIDLGRDRFHHGRISKAGSAWARAGDGLGRSQSFPDVIVGSTVPTSMHANPLKNRDADAYSRILPFPDADGSVSAAGARPGLQNR